MDDDVLMDEDGEDISAHIPLYEQIPEDESTQMCGFCKRKISSGYNLCSFDFYPHKLGGILFEIVI